MKFVVAARGEAFAGMDSDCCYLRHLGWDDWFKFETLFSAKYVDNRGTTHDLGTLKIGEFGLRGAPSSSEAVTGFRRPAVPPSFSRLPDKLFSLGQDPSYYETLNRLGMETRDRFLRAMRDIAFDEDLRERALEEPVTGVSLLREVPLKTLEHQFARIARGGAALTPFLIEYSASNLKVPLEFSVEPASRPPTNIHVLIGRNGVGKSTLLNSVAAAVIGVAPGAAPLEYNVGGADEIANVVSVSFSAFDSFEPLAIPQNRSVGPSYHYVGLKKKRPAANGQPALKDPAALSSEMTLATKSCLIGARRQRLERALSLLEGDPVFAMIGFRDRLIELTEEEFLDTNPELFRRLSSGHKIVLLTVLRLVETVGEKTLVLLDEPEAHLHPPLLSAFVRTLSDLLTNRNGVAIVATHSPVVLQEVPRSCVWQLRRVGNEATAERPVRETFGENVGRLTDDVFGLEVAATGFHKMIAELALSQPSYEAALDALDGQLGSEGRALLRIMMNTRDESRHVGR